MSPRKEPMSLTQNCVRSCVRMINTACYAIEMWYPFDDMPRQREMEIYHLKCYLMTLLPARLFDLLCSNRTCLPYRGDPRTQLQILTHPCLTNFRKSELDNVIPEKFWIDVVLNLTNLVVLDLKFICTDEILFIIGESCPALIDLNIVSKVDVCKSLFNASVLRRNVSDAGLSAVANLKNLRVLTMDPPRNERSIRIGRCVSQTGIILLLKQLPVLEELLIDTCDMGSALLSSHLHIDPLNLKKMNCHFASAEGITKLLKICPKLNELSVAHLSEHNKDDILIEIAVSNVRLHKLDLSFFSFTQSMEHLLFIKGVNLTHFSLWEMEHTLTFDAILCIGKCCPNLFSLCIVTQSKCLVIPKYIINTEPIFTNLHNLRIGNDFNIHHMLNFFFKCSPKLETIVLKYQTKTNIDGTLLHLLQKGRMTNVYNLWLDCTLEVSKDVIVKVIQMCHRLHILTVNFHEDMSSIYKFIDDNNYDLKFGSY